MNWRLAKGISLRNDRVKRADADRQLRTAREILRRFDRQPGVVLADEVGMGKTYVALAVAASVAAEVGGKRPIVVMVPPSVAKKWPREWEVFRSACLKHGPGLRATAKTVSSGSEFLKLLDDPPERHHQIVFLTHGALTRQLGDELVRLAIVREALKRPSLMQERRAFPRWASSLIPHGSRLSPEVTRALLDRPPSEWRPLWKRETRVSLPDDPVPKALIAALKRVDLGPLINTCREIPLRESEYLEERLERLRTGLTRAVEGVWRQALRAAHLHLPLLVLDEAHHTKNPRTGLAGLFADREAEEDAALLGGPLAGVFDRMLFLTATPLQLGHGELIEVLRRFSGIRWHDLDRVKYEARITRLEETLNLAQAASLRLDRAWGRLTPEDFVGAPQAWWQKPEAEGLSNSLRDAAAHVGDVRDRTRAAQGLLRPFVIRHARPNRDERRKVHCGQAIVDDGERPSARGLQVEGGAVLPFLLAARAQGLVAADGQRRGVATRAFFAEGLASSFEAYRQTRVMTDPASVLDEASVDGAGILSDETVWYLERIREALPDDGHGTSGERRGAWGEHPKLAATVRRAIELWNRDEKVLIFCFYRATGRALRDHIARAVDHEIVRQAAEQLGHSPDDGMTVRDELRRLSDRFFDPKAPVTRLARREVRRALRGRVEDESLDDWATAILRFLRTPSFLVRYMPLDGSAPEAAFRRALTERDRAGRTLRQRLRTFSTFLDERIPSERAELLEELKRVETRAVAPGTAPPSRRAQGERADVQVPNVRLANGDVERATRERLMLAFNTPFFPEILVASSVMAEGVDLHLHCRHVIHHDLDWNPAVIEQRTGRLDRLGSLAEQTKKPLVVYEPFLEATQDEKQFRVMKDRERWFNVVMGERLELDEWSTERLSERVPLPVELARELTFDLALR